MKDSANAFVFLSVLVIGLLSSQAANAGFLIDAQTWHGKTTPPTGVILVGDNNKALHAADLAKITKTPVNWLNLLFKMNAGSKTAETSSLLGSSLSLDIFGVKENNNFTLVNSKSFPMMDLLSPLYMVVKGGNHDPNQYVIDLRQFTSNGSVWNGMAPIMGTNFWAGPKRGGEISHIALWGSVAEDDLSGSGDQPDSAVVPEPATVALFAFGLFCFACGPVRRRMQKVAVGGQAG